VIYRGSLKVNTLPEILHSICMSEATGMLVLQLYNIKKKIYFEEGKILFAYSNLKRDSLGDVLLREGIITLEQYIETSKKVVPGVRHGQVLLKEKIIDVNELVQAVQKQVQSIIFSVFDWSEGSFEFIKAEKKKESIKLNITSSNLIFNGVKRITDFQVLNKVIGSLDNVIVKAPNFDKKLKELELTSEEMDIASFSNGKKVREILRKSLLKDFDTVRILSGFITIDVLRSIKQETYKLSLISGDFSEISYAIKIFNSVFEELFLFLSKRIGTISGNILIKYFNEVSGEFPDVFRDISPSISGKINEDIFKLNFVNSGKDEEFFIRALFSLLTSYFRAIEESLGRNERDIFENKIKEKILKMFSSGGK